MSSALTPGDHLRHYYVCILASKRNGTLYIGLTSNLQSRVWEHKHNAVNGFTKKYGVRLLVYYEIYRTPYEAIVREKRLKKWKRQWKLNLINKANPTWRDLHRSSGGILPLPVNVTEAGCLPSQA